MRGRADTRSLHTMKLARLLMEINRTPSRGLSTKARAPTATTAPGRWTDGATYEHARPDRRTRAIAAGQGPYQRWDHLDLPSEVAL
jgi:hypothetical protein